MSVRKLLNPDAQPTNILVFHDHSSGCCGKEGTLCGYALDIAPTGVTGITINGTLVNFDAAATSAKDFRVKAAAALLTLGYDAYYEDAYRGIQANDSRIVFVSEAVINSVEKGGAQALTQRCTNSVVTQYTGAVEFDTDAGLLSYNQATGTQVGTNAGFPADDTAPVIAAVKAAVIAQIGGATVYHKVNVIQDDVYGGYQIYIDLAGSSQVTLGGAIMTQSFTYPDYTA